MTEKKDNQEENLEKCPAGDILFESEDALIETEKMTPQEKKEYLEFLWRRRFFSC
jgi:hypothetical protein